MGECGCGPDEERVYQIGENRLYVRVDWHVCPGCEAEPAVQLIRDKYVIEAAIENGVKVEVLREPGSDGRNTGAVILGDEETDKLLQAALSHIGSEHVHDREECSAWLTTHGERRKKPDLYDDWPPAS